MMSRRPYALAALAALCLAAVQPAWAELGLSAIQALPRLDVRMRGGEPIADTLRVMQLETGLLLSVTDGESELATVLLELNAETPMTGRARQMHFSNAYALINTGTGSPRLKVGQFVVPFGTLAEYDTHDIPLQTPYARTLGIRLDRGIGIEGFSDEWDYQSAVTSGDGRHRHANGYALTARAARDYEFGDDFLRVGISGLVGEEMPVFPTNAMSLSMGMDDMVEHRDKWRLALDADWLRGIDNIRAEFVFGADDGDSVDGQWLSYNHPFSYGEDVTVQADRWRQDDGESYGLGAQYHRRIDDWSGVRAAYEKRWVSRSALPDTDSDTWTIQYYREWAWTPNL